MVKKTYKKKLTFRNRKKRKIRKTKKKYITRQRGGGYDTITGTKLCGDKHNYYVGKLFAGSSYEVFSLCKDKAMTNCELNAKRC